MAASTVLGLQAEPGDSPRRIQPGICLSAVSSIAGLPLAQAASGHLRLTPQQNFG